MTLGPYLHVYNNSVASIQLFPIFSDIQDLVDHIPLAPFLLLSALVRCSTGTLVYVMNDCAHCMHMLLSLWMVRSPGAGKGSESTR